MRGSQKTKLYNLCILLRKLYDFFSYSSSLNLMLRNRENNKMNRELITNTNMINGGETTE